TRAKKNLPQQVLQGGGGVRLRVAVLDDHGGLEGDPPFGPFPFAHGARAGNHDGPGGDLQGAPRGLAVFETPRDVVDRRAAGQDDAGGENRALAYDRTLVDAAVAADQNVVLDDDRQLSHGLENAADLRGGGQVHA